MKVINGSFFVIMLGNINIGLMVIDVLHDFIYDENQ